MYTGKKDGSIVMSNIKKLPNQKSTQKKSSVVPFTKRGERGVVVNIEEKINKAIELRLGRFVKEIQSIKAKQKRIEARQKAKRAKGIVEPIGQTKKMRSKIKPKLKSTKNKNKPKNKKNHK